MSWRIREMKRMGFTLVLSLVLAICPGVVLTQQSRARRGKGRRGAPKVGEMAPIFKLLSLDGRAETDLASFKGKRPMVLFIGSYT
jgi:hypothetical protein